MLLPAFAVLSQSSGQNFTISPYSNFGLGEVTNANISEAGYNHHTYSGSYSHSFMNPATLCNLQYTTFDFGLNLKQGLIQSQDAKRSFYGGGLSYLNLAFRTVNKSIPVYTDSAGVKKKKKNIPIHWNSSLGIYPVTTIGYNYTAEDTTPFLTRALHSGKGGINSLQFGNGIGIGKNIAIGYSASYLFGQISDRSVFTAPDSADLMLVDDEKSVYIHGLQNQLGILYQFQLDSTYHKFGASLKWFSAMAASRQRFTQVFGYSGGSVSSVDTVLDNSTPYEHFSVPSAYGFGYNFQWRKKWSIGLDYYHQRWGNYNAFFQQNQKLANRTDYGITFILNPVDEKLAGTKRMAIPFRMGARFSNTQNVFTNAGVETNIQEQSVFVGFGIPFVRRYYNNEVLRSMINFRVDYTTRGTLNNGLVKEQYLVGTITFNLGDIWFQRRKFD